MVALECSAETYCSCSADKSEGTIGWEFVISPLRARKNSRDQTHLALGTYHHTELNFSTDNRGRNLAKGDDGGGSERKPKEMII